MICEADEVSDPRVRAENDEGLHAGRETKLASCGLAHSIYLTAFWREREKGRLPK